MNLTYKAPAKIFKNDELLKQALFREDGNTDWTKDPTPIDNAVIFRRSNKRVTITFYKGEPPRKSQERSKPIIEEPQRVPLDLRRPEGDIGALDRLKDKAEELKKEIEELRKAQASIIKDEEKVVKEYKNRKEEYKKKLYEQEAMERKGKSIIKHVNKELKKRCDSRISSIKSSSHI